MTLFELVQGYSDRGSGSRSALGLVTGRWRVHEVKNASLSPHPVTIVEIHSVWALRILWIDINYCCWSFSARVHGDSVADLDWSGVTVRRRTAKAVG